MILLRFRLDRWLKEPLQFLSFSLKMDLILGRDLNLPQALEEISQPEEIYVEFPLPISSIHGSDNDNSPQEIADKAYVGIIPPKLEGP
jgi:hypothetical protein